MTTTVPARKQPRSRERFLLAPRATPRHRHSQKLSGCFTIRHPTGLSFSRTRLIGLRVASAADLVLLTKTTRLRPATTRSLATGPRGFRDSTYLCRVIL